MKHIVIIGAGPRGLAMALRASMYNYKITVVDPTPISTWGFPYMLADMEMRSPITFDLVTFQEDLQDYSLCNFLGRYTGFINTQKEVEASTDFCNRKEFVRYLKYIIEVLRGKGVVFAKHFVSSISENYIHTKNTDIPYDYLISSIGRKGQELNKPRYVDGKNIISLSQLHEQSWFKVPVNVVGSGQQAAEIVNYLCTQKADVSWILKHEPIVHQYPLPSCSVWGKQTALGDYYYKIAYNKQAYLKRVKAWGPSITPYINNKLKKQSYKTILNPKSTEEINLEAGFVLAAGSKNEVKLLNFDFDLARYKPNDRYPNLTTNFQSTSHPNIYFTGLLASNYDGPRQGSIISSGPTAHSIITSINNG